MNTGPEGADGAGGIHWPATRRQPGPTCSGMSWAVVAGRRAPGGSRLQHHDVLHHFLSNDCGSSHGQKVSDDEEESVGTVASGSSDRRIRGATAPTAAAAEGAAVSAGSGAAGAPASPGTAGVLVGGRSASAVPPGGSSGSAEQQACRSDVEPAPAPVEGGVPGWRFRRRRRHPTPTANGRW